MKTVLRGVCAVLSLAAAMAAWAADLPLGHPDFLPSPQRPVGFRGAGDGQYPGATPVVDFDVATGKKLLWKTALPALKASQPVVIGKQVIVLCEPDTVAAFDLATGALRWKTTAGVFAKAPPEVAENWRKMREIEASPTAEKQRGEFGNLFVALNGFGGDKGHLPGPGNPSTPTPCSDGQRIYVRFGMGPVGAFDLDGKLLWLTGGSDGKFERNSTSSALYVDGFVLARSGRSLLVAHDAATGAVKWSAKIVSGHFGVATHAIVRMAGQAYVFTDGGQVARVSDGKLMASGLGEMDGPSSPVASGEQVFFQQGKPLKDPAGPRVRGVRLGVVNGTVTGRELFTVALLHSGASPLVHDGLVYWPNPDGTLRILEAATGKVVLAPQATRTKGRAAADLCLAGKYLVLQDADGFRFVEPGAAGQEAGRGKCAGLVSTPSFAGRRMLFTTMRELICVGEP